MPPSSRVTFERELKTLRDDVLMLSIMVDNAIQQSTIALKQQNVDLARQIIAEDKKINDLRYKIEDDAYTLIARQQPIARDLRGIIAAIHIAIELERIGDYAAGNATLAVELANEPLLKPLIDIPKMAEISRDMLRTAINAYIHWDIESAKRTIQCDTQVDTLDERVYHELLDLMLQDRSKVARATFLLWISHNMERIADRITNICERVIYMVTGQVHGTDGIVQGVDGFRLADD